MASVIPRPHDAAALDELLALFPVVAILGPRQCGKTTMAHSLDAGRFFDLEDARDAAVLANPYLALEDVNGLVVLDEIQRRQDLFPVLRTLADSPEGRRFLILGSASIELVRHVSESLAGRIGFHQLGGFRIGDAVPGGVKQLWLRGGFPRSTLAASDRASMLWRQNFIRTFLERDIPALGIGLPAAEMRRFWTMLAHYHGQVLNFSEFGRSFGVTDMTVRRYIAILEGTYMVRVLKPWSGNIGKRLTKSPKLYVRDSGLLHALLTINDADALRSHPKLGASWEGFALEQTIRALEPIATDFAFWRTHAGAELDLVWSKGGMQFGAEFKYADAPTATKSMRTALADLHLARIFVVHPGADSYPIDTGIEAVAVSELDRRLTG